VPVRPSSSSIQPTTRSAPTNLIQIKAAPTGTPGLAEQAEIVQVRPTDHAGARLNPIRDQRTMRSNLPVVDREFDLPQDVTLMSTTDAQSRITHANAAFIAVSGFEEHELLGQPHNIVRHPDMPARAFADMWATLKAGEAWTGIVKNRRKNGEYYWVRANVTPLVRGGSIVGYLSVRTRPGRQEVARAEILYRALRDETNASCGLHKGLVRRTGVMRWASVLQTLPVRWRLRLPVLAMLAASTAAALLAGSSMASTAAALALQGLIAGIAMIWLERDVSRPLEQVLQQAQRISTGQTSESLHLDRVDEIGLTLRTINQMGLMFRWIIDDVSGQVRLVRSVSGDIAQGNSDLSARTEQAAARLEETAASMEQMSSSVRNNSDAASRAAELAVVATAAATSGGSAVSQMTATMEEITTSSRKISDIIGLIDSIAFQTTILALNAAVEAARAGDQGRGFAVVATEVRSLARRSTLAAKEIKTLIGSNVERIESGGKKVEEASCAMAGIVQKVRQVNALVDEISTASREQTAGISQVSEAVSQLDRATQQNAALVEQSAAAAQSLKLQTSQLGRAVAVFARDAGAAG